MRSVSISRGQLMSSLLNDCHLLTWSGEDSEQRLHASMDVVSYVAMKQPRAGIVCQHLHHFKGPREQVHHVCSVVLPTLSSGRGRWLLLTYL